MSYNTPINVASITVPLINSPGIIYLNPSSYTQFGSGGVILKSANVSTTSTLNIGATVIMCTGLSGSIVLTLPSISGFPNGFTYIIKDADGTAATNTITLDGAAAETIDGAATYLLNNAYESVTLIKGTAQWSVC